MQRARVAGRGKIEGSAWKILWRLLRYIFQESHFALFVAFFSIIISSAAAVIGTMFIQQLIDDYITPLTKAANPNFAPLLNMIILMGAVYLLGVLGTLLYTQVMIMTGHDYRSVCVTICSPTCKSYHYVTLIPTIMGTL